MIVIVHKNLTIQNKLKLKILRTILKFLHDILILYITINDTLNRPRFFELSLKNSDFQKCDSHPKMKFYSKGINFISFCMLFFLQSICMFSSCIRSIVFSVQFHLIILIMRYQVYQEILLPSLTLHHRLIETLNIISTILHRISSDG